MITVKELRRKCGRYLAMYSPILEEKKEFMEFITTNFLSSKYTETIIKGYEDETVIIMELGVERIDFSYGSLGFIKNHTSDYGEVYTFSQIIDKFFPELGPMYSIEENFDKLENILNDEKN